MGKNSGPILSRLWTKVHEIFGHRRRPFVPSNAFAPLSMSRFTLQIFAIKSRNREKPNKCKTFWPHFSGETTHFSTAYCQCDLLSTDSCLSPVCWSPSAKPGNEMECRIYEGWVKTHLQFEAVCGPKFMLFWDDVGDPTPRRLQRTCSVMCLVFPSEDTGR